MSLHSISSSASSASSHLHSITSPASAIQKTKEKEEPSLESANGPLTPTDTSKAHQMEGDSSTVQYLNSQANMVNPLNLANPLVKQALNHNVATRGV